MTVNVYRSTDAGAPTLTGSAGALLTVLDAVLVNGYGSKSAAGWTIAYTGTYQRVYTMASGGTGYSLYINDNAPTVANEAQATGFRAPSGLGAGTGQFPTYGQVAIGIGAVVIRKSSAVSSTAVTWTVVADGHTIYFFAETGDQTLPVTALPFAFGDFFSYSATDINNCMIIGRPVQNTGSFQTDPFSVLAGYSESLVGTQYGQYCASSWTNVGGAVQFGKNIDNMCMAPNVNTVQNSTGGMNSNSINVFIGRNSATTVFPYPNGPDGALWLSPVRIVHSGAFRGYLKGIWAPLHDRPLNHDDTFTISGGNLSGKSMLMQNIPVYASGSAGSSVGDNGQVAVETSNTWS